MSAQVELTLWPPRRPRQVRVALVLSSGMRVLIYKQPMSAPALAWAEKMVGSLCESGAVRRRDRRDRSELL